MNEPAPNELTFVPAVHTYDAAGRQLKVTQTTTRQEPDPPNNPVSTTVATTDTGHDGDGQQMKRVTTTQINSHQPESEVTYYLRSSMLGGFVITDYNANGARQKSYVYGGGVLIASGGNGALLWRYNNPVTGDGRETSAQGGLQVATYLDPEGIDAGATDPANAPSDPGQQPQPMAGAYGAFFLGGSQSCKVDGMEVGCALVANVIAVDEGYERYLTLSLGGARPRINPGHITDSPMPRPDSPNALALGGANSWSGNGGGGPDLSGYTITTNTWARVDRGMRGVGVYIAVNGSILSLYSTRPQNTPLTPEQLAGLKKDLKDTLKGPCGDFTKVLLNQLGNSYSNDAMTLFNKVGEQGGFSSLASAPPFGLAWGTIGARNAAIGIRLPAGDNAMSHNAVARSLIHELVHVLPLLEQVLDTQVWHKQLMR